VATVTEKLEALQQSAADIPPQSVAAPELAASGAPLSEIASKLARAEAATNARTEPAPSVNKITWPQVGRVTEPGRYMFKFGWLTITANDLAVWKQYPAAASPSTARARRNPKTKWKRKRQRNFVWVHSICASISRSVRNEALQLSIVVLAVPELTSPASIQLNERVSLRRREDHIGSLHRTLSRGRTPRTAPEMTAKTLRWFGHVRVR